MTSLAEKVFWTMIALSSIGATAYGYHRFKLIRPDLYDDGQKRGISEDERKARIADYQQQGDALTRAANPPARLLKPGETCANGVVVTSVREGDNVEAKAVVENGKPVHCVSSNR